MGRATRVLYIMGAGRSGTTLLGNVLGELTGCFHAGQLRIFWTMCVPGHRLCGCEQKVTTCDLWSDVLQSAFPDHSEVDALPARVTHWQREAVRFRHTASLLRARGARAALAPPLAAYVETMSRLYQAIAEVTGASIIVDSSKRPADAALLELVPAITPLYLHVVRDARAVAYSWRRRKYSPAEGRKVPQHGSIVSSRTWLARNVAFEAIRMRVGAARSRVVRYEDFIRHPHQELTAIERLVGLGSAHLPIVEGRTITFRTNHTAGGNPHRFRIGDVELREDNEWLTAQTTVDRLVVTGMTFPLLHRYKYGLRVSQTSDGIPLDSKP